jgi:hypothetical protein
VLVEELVPHAAWSVGVTNFVKLGIKHADVLEDNVHTGDPFHVWLYTPTGSALIQLTAMPNV